MTTYNHQVADLRKEMWIGGEVIEDDMPHALDAVPTVEVKPFCVQKKVTLPIKEKAASFGHFTVLLEVKHIFEIFLSETYHLKIMKLHQYL